MTDQELIELVRQKPPDELTSDEIALLRARMRQSASLRDTLAEQMRLDHCLSAALGNVRVSVDKILAAAGATAGPPRPWAGWYGWGAGAVLLFIVSAAIILPRWLRQTTAPPDGTELAQAEASPESNGPAREMPARDNDAHEPPADGGHDAADDMADDDDKDAAWLADGSSPSDERAGHRVEIEAESFQRGNVQVDADEFGAGIGVIRSGQVRPSFVEHEFEVPATGEYELEVRYAAEQPRPFKILIGGREVEMEGPETGGWKAGEQRWSAAGAFQLAAGRHVMRMEAAGELPHIDKLAFTTSFASADQGPWTVGLEQEVAFAENCFDDYDADSPGMGFDEVKRWLLPVEWNQEQIRARPGHAATIDGILRLRSPWPNHAALRLSLYEQHQFRMHLWHGRRGVSLYYYAYPRPCWVAYAATRATPKDVRPKSLAMLATDSDRYRRTGLGTIALHYHDGFLAMMRGDVRLMTVPLAGTPEEVYFDGHAAVRQLSMSRTTPPPEAAVDGPVVVKSSNPARMAWHTSLPDGAELNKLDDGRLELVGKNLKSQATAALPLSEAGLYEVVFQVENAQPGSGVMLADSRGRPIHRLGFFREHRSGWTSIGFLPPKRDELLSSHDADRLPAPFVGKRPWIRLVQGPGIIKCWISGDGVHWSPAFDPEASAEGFKPIAQVGLYLLGGEGSRGIRLRSLEVRELSEITSLAAALWKDTPVAAIGREDEIDLGTWLQIVLESQPAQADPGEWRRTCAVRTLQAGTPRNLGNDLLLCLLRDALSADLPPARRLRLLDEAALLADTWQADIARKLAQELVDQYAVLGHRLADSGEARPFCRVCLAAYESPLWTDADLEMLPDGLIRRELLDAVHKEQWSAAAELSRRVEFWTRTCDPHRPGSPRHEALLRLAAWAGAASRRQLDGFAASVVTASAAGHHPLVEELGKEAFNILGEFNAALAGNSYDEACRILSSARTERALGLLPDANDGQLLVSLSEAVQSAFRRHPGLLRTMQQKFAPAGKVRVRQAAEAGDTAMIEAATVQYSGTDAAAEAFQWLGDRALAAGDFASAARQYRQAVNVKAWSGRAGGLARLRLAAAMLGKVEGQPATVPVDFGGSRLSPSQFESLVDDMLRRRPDRGPIGEDLLAAAGDDVPPPSAFVSAAWATFDGLGAAAASSGAAMVPGRDAASREIATAMTADALLVSNRWQVASYNLSSGQKSWTATAATAPGEAHTWLRCPMTPVVAGSRVFVRMMAEDGPKVCCLSSNDGSLVWTSRAGLVAVSDPLLVQDQLLCVTSDVEYDRSLRLSLTSLDPQTGDVTSQRTLTRVRDVWDRQLTCRLTAARNQLLATFGGCVMCCDSLGSPRWLRRQTFVPPAEDAHFAEQDHDPPVLATQMMFVSQPGMRAVECLDMATGRLQWRASLPRLQRVLGLADSTIVVRTAAGLQGINSKDGSTAWRMNAADLLEASLAAGGRVLLARGESLTGGKLRPRLVWLDAATGLEVGSTPLDDLVDEAPALGPLVQQGKRTWAFFGRGASPATRELIELTPQGNASPAAPTAVELAGWTAMRDIRWQNAVNHVLPGWTLLASETDERTGACLEHLGQRDVLATQSPGGYPARLARWVTVPTGEKALLRIQVGHDTQHPWRLEIRAGGRTLLAEVVSPQTAAAGWREFEVDLSSLAGSGAWITVSQQPEGDMLAPAYWKRLELASTGP
ncbi:MAG: PQQ-binding-like beta-propeller repeat protein [Pirellulales bacterium]